MIADDRLKAALEQLPMSVEEMRAAVRMINDAPDLDELLKALADLAISYALEPDQGLADTFVALRASLGQIRLEPEQHELAQDRWKAFRAARGNLYADIDQVLSAASTAGAPPGQPASMPSPDSEMVERKDHQRHLAVLDARAREVARMLDERIAPEGLPGADRVPAQLIQVNRYLLAMRRNIRLLDLTLSVGDRVDLSALERVITAMGRITRGFHVSVTSAASRATASLRTAVGAIRRPVRKLALGFGRMARIALRAAREPAAPPVEDVVNDAERGLRAIIAADPAFDLAQFLEGAKGAYRMILEAFWKADSDTLQWLVEAEVLRGFKDAIADRTQAGHTLDNRLIAVERVMITDASVEDRTARIAVRFDADIAAVTRDESGAVIAGSLTDAVETSDIWTFTRSLRSDDPNWKLVETDEA